MEKCVRCTSSEMIESEGYEVPKCVEILTLGDKLNNGSFKYNGIPFSVEYENDNCYLLVYTDEVEIDGETKDVTILHVSYLGDDYRELNNMSGELWFLGSDLLSMNFSVYDSDTRKVQSGQLPVYSIGLSDGKLTLKHYDGEQVKKLKSLVGDDVFRFWIDESVAQVEDASLLPDDKNQAVIDVSNMSVEGILETLIGYLEDKDHTKINDDIANHSKAKSKL